MTSGKEVSMFGSISRLIRCFGDYRKQLLLIIAIGLVVNILLIVGPQFLSQMTDLVSESIESGSAVDIDAIARTALILVAIYGSAALLEAIFTRRSWIVEEVTGDMMRIDLSRKVSRIPVAIMDGLKIGDIMSRFVNDTDTIRLRAIDCIARSVDAVVLIIGVTIAMFLTEWRLALVSIVPTICGFIVIRILIRRSRKYYMAQSVNLGKLNSVIKETYEGIDIVRTYNGMEGTRSSFLEINDTLYTSAFRSRFMSGLAPEITGFVNNLGYVMVCIFGSIFILQGTSSYGVLVAFIVYVKLSNQPLMRLSNSLNSLQEVSTACQRIFEFMDHPEMEDEKGIPSAEPEYEGRVRFDSVCFSYVEGKQVIDNLDLEVEPGQKIAIVGPTGAGKTTIANLLLRFYDPDSGSISIDGRDICSIRRGDVRRLFGVVTQESWLFSGTLRQNIAFDRDVSDEVILSACEAVGLGSFVASLPDGVDTMIEDPNTLSSGQKQQLTIARAIVKDAPLLIMDEATSSVDTRTEKIIEQAMNSLMHGRTSFVIAHRLSTIKNADVILVIRKGRIVEKGTHESLLRMNGFYKELFDSQFEFCD